MLEFHFAELRASLVVQLALPGKHNLAHEGEQHWLILVSKENLESTGTTKAMLTREPNSDST